MADDLLVSIRRDFGFPGAAGAGGGSKLSEITTSSEEAYSLYLEGLDHSYSYDYAAAQESFRKAVAIDPGFALAYWRLAWAQVQFGMGDMRSAAASAETAYSLRWRLPEKERLFVEWLSGFFKTGIEETLHVLEALTAKYPEEKEAWFLLAAGQGGPMMNPHKAVALHQKWLALDRGFKVGYVFLVRDYLNLDDLDRAAESARRYVEIAPEDASAHKMMGYVHYFKGEFDRAREEFEKALQLDPNHYDAVIGQAQVLAKSGRFAESGAILAALLRRQTEPVHRVGAYFQLGWNALAQKKHGEAEEYFRQMSDIIRAAQLSIMIPFSDHALGWAYLTAGKLNDARQEFATDLERSDPMVGIYGPAASHYFLAVTYLKMGLPDKARAEAEGLERLAEAGENPLFLAWNDDLIAKIGAGQMSDGRPEEIRAKRPRFYYRAWFGWMTDIPGGIPLE
jgi:tetratricopeptide (TPR) repeat protein